MKTISLSAIAIIMLSLCNSNLLNAQNMNKENSIPQLSAFPVGDKNPQENAQYFIGQSYLAPLTTDAATSSRVYNVTFEPACRNNWHSHSAGQILMAVGGKGYYQEKGKPARVMMPGDVIEIAPNVVHWHGATPDSWFSHIGITPENDTNKTTWLKPVDNRQYKEATAVKSVTPAPGYFARLATTDPELSQIMTDFAFVETQQHVNLDLRTRILVTMVSSIAVGGREEYRQTLYNALGNGITPVEIKEVLYHAVPYAGMAKVADMIGIANEVLTQSGVSIPLEPQAVVTPENRQEKGLAFQKSIFGDVIDRGYASAPKGQLYIQKLLSANCFGDYQTRLALDVKMRELLTYSVLISLGGCEPQVKGHIQGNLNVGNDKATLLAVTTQLLPGIGYPRTLNAVACLNEVIPE